MKVNVLDSNRMNLRFNYRQFVKDAVRVVFGTVGQRHTFYARPDVRVASSWV